MINSPNEIPATDNGKIVSFFSGVAKVEGLSHVFLYEQLLDQTGQRVGLVIGFEEKFCEVLLFDENFDPGNLLFRSGKQFSIPVSESFLGRVIDGLGQPIDELGPLHGDHSPVFKDAPTLIDRIPVTTPLTTGIKMLDALLPLGRGQRELIIGDRKLGKSTIALDIILNQKHATPKMVCIYVLCGQKQDKLDETIRILNDSNAFLYTTVVATPASSSFAQSYLAPFVGCTIGEYFRDLGQDVVIVYDDLSQHAKSYRNIALLLERAPGRETYPGDIFSLHASLLERAGNVQLKTGQGSLTALPIVETQEGDVTGFIPTNIISITDGQIYLEKSLYQKGFLPSINSGLSVSRVGSAAQPGALRRATAGLRLALSQNQELQKLVQLETTVSKEALAKIHRGDLLLELLKQDKHTFVSWPEQVVLFLGVEEGLFDNLDKQQWGQFRKLLLEFVNFKQNSLLQLLQSRSWDESMRLAVKDTILQFRQEFME